MRPFTFGSDRTANRAELERFESLAGRWKPSGLQAEYGTRLDFFLHRQDAHVERTLKKRYTKTWEEVAPYLETLRLTRFFVEETAKVFMSGHGLELSRDGKPLANDSDEAKRWADVVEESALALKLKLTDRYTTLDRTCFLRPDREEGGPLGLQVFLADNVDVVPDPAHPFDLDRAYGVRLRLGGDDELSPVVGADGRSTSKGALYEFWCARPGEEQYRRLYADGTPDPVPGNEAGELPYEDENGRGVIPLVMFTLHAEELGIFTDEGRGLWKANLAADVTATDLGYIAAVQGFGQLVITYPASAGSLQQEVVIGPTRAIELKDGATADMLSPSPQITGLLDLLDKKVRRAANLAGIPPGSVSLEGRQVPSGIALQIEMRPLLEARTDAIDFYRAPMKRLWRLIQIVHDTRLGEGEPELRGIEARWAPGELQLPESETELVDRLSRMRRQGWISDVEAVARLRKIPPDEAEKVLEEIRSRTKVVEPAPGEDPLGLKTKREELDGPEPQDPGSEPVTVPEPGATAAAGVVQDTALNGAQVSSLLEIVVGVANGEIPIDTAEAILRAAFPAMPVDLVSRIIDGLKGFVPENTAPPPVKGPPGPPVPPAPAG